MEGFAEGERGARVLDAAALLAVPLGLIAIHVLATPEQKSLLAFHYGSVEPHAFVTATYVHFGVEHLYSNVFGYVTAAVMAYLLCLQLGRRRWFRITVGVLVFVAPFAINAASFLFLERYGGPPVVSGRGFSGVVAGLGGFVFVALLGYVARNHGRVVAAATGQLLVIALLVELYLLWIGLPGPVAVLTFGSCLLVGVVGIALDAGVPTGAAALRQRAAAAVPIALVAVLLGAFVAGLFPGSVVRDGVVLNVYAHAAGLVVGVVTAAVVAVVVDEPKGATRTDVGPQSDA